MFGRSRTDVVKDNAVAAADLAAALSQDKKFRKQLLAGVGHGVRAKQRVAARIGIIAALSRIAADEQLRDEARQMARNLQNAWTRVEKKRSHRVRNTLLVLVGAGGAVAAAAAAKSKNRFAARGTTPRTVQADVEVDVPVSTAYNQWTQFEEFPRFMQGVDEVRQLDDTRLHWVASIAGRRAEWDAKILEQHPDSQISWVSEDGKKTRGTVSFESLGEGRTLVRLSMSYQVEGFVEAVGSAAGADKRRIEGDLKRFKDLIESREAETGAWRGDISAGSTS